MEDNFRDYFTGCKELFKKYFGVRWKLFQLEAYEKISSILGRIITLIAMGVMIFFMVIFLGFLFAYWMANLTGSLIAGFALAAALFFLLFIVLLLFGKWIIRKPAASFIVRKVSKKIRKIKQQKKSA